ncbi:MAG: DUF6262 family protein [Cyanobacteria bacterium P01_E01_bin.6]
MKAERNTKGLRQNAQKKRQETFEKVEQGIKQLIKEKRSITFNEVSRASGVSKAWLYKEPGIKARIEQLRAQSGNTKALPVKQRASDTSKDALIRTLKERIKKLEVENRDLRRQNEIAYGEVLKIREQQKLSKFEDKESAKVESSVKSAQLCKPEPDNKRDQFHLSLISNENLLHEELKSLGVKLNSTLKQLIQNTPQGIVKTSMDSLREAMQKTQINSPGGFLYKAISDAWQPNGDCQAEVEIEEFNQWWKWAYKEGLVRAATRIDNIQYVLTSDEEWRPFEEMLLASPYYRG